MKGTLGGSLMVRSNPNSSRSTDNESIFSDEIVLFGRSIATLWFRGFGEVSGEEFVGSIKD